jgi:poly(A) polymerase
MELLIDAGIKAVPTGIEHGTVTAIVNNTPFQITTLRKDIKTDGRHAVVEFTEDWRTDAMRRDFTFNTLSADQDGMVHDYLNGLQDLANRVINFVGVVDDRIAEDRLRILRYFRFIAVFGMRIGDRREFEVCVNNSKYLAELSRERIRGELFKIIGSKNHFDVLRLMYDHEVLAPILPEAKVSEVFRRLTWLETSALKFDAVKPDTIRRLASLVEIDDGGFDDLAKRLVLSNAEKTHLRQLVSPAWSATPDIGDDELRALLYRMEASIVIDLVLLEWSRRLIMTPKLPKGESDNWQKIIAAAEASEKLNFPLRGRDVLELGVEKGPRVSKILSEVESWWTKGGCHGSRDDCLERLENLVDR